VFKRPSFLELLQIPKSEPLQITGSVYTGRMTLLSHNLRIHKRIHLKIIINANSNQWQLKMNNFRQCITIPCIILQIIWMWAADVFPYKSVSVWRVHAVWLITASAALSLSVYSWQEISYILKIWRHLLCIYFWLKTCVNGTFYANVGK